MNGTAHSLTADELARIARIDQLVATAGVTELIASLGDRSWTVRRAAVAGLASLGDEAAGPMCAWLLEQRTSEHAIAAAVDVLSTSVGAGATQAVIELASHGTGAVLEDVARILGRRRAFEGVPLLRRFLDDANDNIAMAAIEALGAIGGTASIEALVGVIESRNFFRTFPAMQVAARSGDPRVIEPLAHLLEDESYQFEAARALGRTGSALATVPLTTLLSRSASDAVARLVVSSLDELWTRAEWSGASDVVVTAIRERFGTAASRFIAVASSGELADRRAAVRILGVVGDASTLGVLTDLLDEPELRPVVTDAIQRIARSNDTTLMHAFASDDPGTRAAVLPVVSSLRSAPAVRKLLADEDPEVRARACDALARIGDTSAVRALFAALDDPHPRVAHAAAAAIHSLGTEETPVLAIAALRSPKVNVRRQALRVIAYLGSKGAFDAVAALLPDPDPRTGELVVAALTALDDPRVDPTLLEVSRSPTATLRAAVMRAAGHRTSETLSQVLDRGLDDDDAWVRYYACQSLGRLGKVGATSRLMQRLSDASAQVRVAAIEALARFDTPDAWQHLMSLARSRDPDEQRAALVGIAQHDQPAALALLLEAARSPEVATQLLALSGLAASAAPAALACLAAAVRSDVGELRDASLSLLGERTDAGAADVLVGAAVASDADHPVHATLSRPGVARVTAIQRRLSTAKEGEVSLLVAALARMRTPEAIQALVAALAEPNPDLRRDSITALVGMGAIDAASIARRMSSDDPDLEVRRASAAAIASPTA